MQGTYFDQEGKFIRPNGAGVASGEDTFWIVDAAIRYRLPKRYGFFSLGVNNLFDETFRYQETARDNVTIQPNRVVFGQLTLSMP